MAGFNMFGKKYPFVSVNNGTGGAVDDIKRNLEYLESFEKVYLCFDRDEAGQKAAIACAKLLSPAKAHIVKLDPGLVDPVGYAKANKQQEFVNTWWKAVVYSPSGILSSSQLKERIRNRSLEPGIPYPFKGLTDLTYGIRKKEAVIVTAPTGVGKTTFLRECEYKILKEDPEAKIGTMFLEESVEESGLGLMSMAGSIPFHLPDAKYTEAEFDEAEKILDEDRVFFYDHFGSNNIDDIIARVRYYAKGLGCGYIFIDHLSIIVSDQQQGDERKLLDQIMTRLKTLTMELDIALIAVVHTNRQGQIRGTAGIEQLANIVIELDRDIKSPDAAKRRTLTAVVAKNRFSGKTGPAFAARYDETTGRLDDLSDEEISEVELTELFGDDTISSVDGERLEENVQAYSN
jgi:twinkle protein